MFNNFHLSKNKLIGIIILICLVFGLYFAWSVIFFRVSGTFPGGKNISFATPYIDIKFNKQLGTNTAEQITGSDNVIKSVEFSERSIRVIFMPLVIDKSYSIGLSEIKSASGDILTKTISFTAKDIDFDKLPKDQQQLLIDNQDQERATTDPILGFVPFGGENFNLTATPTTDENLESSVELTAELILTNADQSSPAEAEALYKQQVLDYIKSVGLKAEDYKINYVVVQPSVNLTTEE